jgi:hypothetical protein
VGSAKEEQDSILTSVDGLMIKKEHTVQVHFFRCAGDLDSATGPDDSLCCGYREVSDYLELTKGAGWNLFRCRHGYEGWLKVRDDSLHLLILDVQEKEIDPD